MIKYRVDLTAFWLFNRLSRYKVGCDMDKENRNPLGPVGHQIEGATLKEWVMLRRLHRALEEDPQSQENLIASAADKPVDWEAVLLGNDEENKDLEDDTLMADAFIHVKQSLMAEFEYPPSPMMMESRVDPVKVLEEYKQLKSQPDLDPGLLKKAEVGKTAEPDKKGVADSTKVLEKTGEGDPLGDDLKGGRQRSTSTGAAAAAESQRARQPTSDTKKAS